MKKLLFATVVKIRALDLVYDGAGFVVIGEICFLRRLGVSVRFEFRLAEFGSNKILACDRIVARKAMD